MKAAVYKKYGPPSVLNVEQVDKPTIQDGHEDRVIVDVHAASVNQFDVLHRRGYPPIRLSNGLFTPKQTIMGIDLSGVVTEIGSEVTRFNVGDAVFGHGFATHAEYARCRQTSLSRVPQNISLHEAAATPCTALTALQALRDVGRVETGQKVLIYGASGGIGHFAVQLARLFGAEVTAVCSTANLSWVKDLGADEVIDYTQENFAKRGKKYHVILDAVGKRTYFNCRAALNQDGIYISEHPLKPLYHPVQLLIAKLMGDNRAKFHLSRPNVEDIDWIAARLEAGKIKPIVERVYSLTQIAEAHRHVENGHTKGKVVIEMTNGERSRSDS